MESLEVIYDAMTYYKIMHWVKKADTDEISGFGTCTLKDGTIKVLDAMLLKQRNGSAHTDIEAEDLGKAEYLLRDSPGELRLWWHSHVKMGCFWSPTDIDTIKLLGKHGWFVATVFNQKWQHKTAFYQGGMGGAPELFLDNLNMRPLFYYTDEMKKPWDEEFEKNVQKAVPPIWSGYGDYGYQPSQYSSGDVWYDGQFGHSRLTWITKDLTRRERKIIEKRSKLKDLNRLLCVFKTESFGKVFWTKDDNIKITKYLAHKSTANVLRPTSRFDIIGDTEEILWASPDFCAYLEWSAQPSATGYTGDREKLVAKLIEGKINRPKVGDDDKVTQLLLSASTEDDKALPDDDDQEPVTANNWVLEALQTMYPNWDDKPRHQQQVLLDDYMDQNGDGWNRGDVY